VEKRGKLSSWVKSKLHGKTGKHCQNHDSLTSVTERKESEVLSEDLHRKACPEGDHHPDSNSNQMVCIFLSDFFGSVSIGNPERHVRKASHFGSKQQ